MQLFMKELKFTDPRLQTCIVNKCELGDDARVAKKTPMLKLE